MDEGLRITVGNDMYYKGSRSKSPQDNLRSRLGPSRHETSRYDKRFDEAYTRRSPPRPNYREWESDVAWPPENPQVYSHTSSDHFGNVSEKRYSPSREYRSDMRQWSPYAKTTYDPDLHRKYPDEERSHSPHPRRSRSPHRYYSPHSYRKSPFQTTAFRSRSRSPNITQRHSHISDQSHSPRRSGGRNALTEDIASSLYSGSGYKSYENESYVDKSDIQSKHALDKLKESYEYDQSDNRKYLHHSSKVALDDEEAYLYGDTGTSKSLHEEPRKQLVHSLTSKSTESRERDLVSEKHAVTPGGFDTNALKNVLKAIGFDFKLSAQSLQKASTSKEKLKSPVSPQLKYMQESVHQKPQQPSPVTTVEPKLAPTLREPGKTSVQFPYLPGAATAIPPSSFLSANILQAPPESNFIVNPAALPFPSNVPVSVAMPQQVIYQQSLPQNTVLPFAQQTSQTVVNVPNRPNLKVVPTVSILPVDSDNLKSKRSLQDEKKARKKRLDHLEIELKNLKKKQAELVRKKKKQFNIIDQEQIKQNSLLQAGVEKQIQEIREAAEKAAGIRRSSESSDSGSSGSSTSSDEESNYNYIDPGHHFCRDCNVYFLSLPEFLGHLHTKSHKKLMNPNYKPWYKKIVFKENLNAQTIHFKGSQFLLPVTGFYCKLCKKYTGDQIAAEEHCKTHDHNLNYMNFSKKNPDLETKHSTSDLQALSDRIKKLKGEQEEDNRVERRERLESRSKDIDESKTQRREQYGDFKDRKYDAERNYDIDRKHDSDRRYDEDRRYDADRKHDIHYKYDPDRKYDSNKKDERYYSSRKDDRYSNDRKEEKQYFDYKEPERVSSKHDFKPDNDLNKQQMANNKQPALHSKSNYPDRYNGSNNSRSSSRVGDSISGASRDSKFRSERDSFDKSKQRRSPLRRRSFSPRRSRSPVRVSSTDLDKSAYKGKQKYNGPPKKQLKDEKRGNKRQSKWSPGYDDLEKSREQNESRNNVGKKQTPPPSSSFGKFTWKKIDKGRGRPINPNTRNNSESKVSMRFDRKNSNIGTRLVRNRSSFLNKVTNFAPGINVRHNKKEGPPEQGSQLPPSTRRNQQPTAANKNKLQTQQGTSKNLLSKQISNPSIQPNVTKSGVIGNKFSESTRKNTVEPPPPGTEDIFHDKEGNMSDVSGISMEIGSDVE